ncbi:unnamed protein product, partial [Ectocarpus fasciculatus]
EVYLDLTISNRPIGRMVFELFADKVPRTAENFRSLVTGEHGVSQSSGRPLHYKGSRFHRVISGFMAQGGDFTHGDGTGGESIYGVKFPDENFLMKHTSPGQLSMANSGAFPALSRCPGTNGSQFFITFRDTPHLDGRHVVFGQIVSGQEVLRVLESVAVDSSDRPRAAVVVADCGQLGVEAADEDHIAAPLPSGVAVGESSTAERVVAVDGGQEEEEQATEEQEEEVDLEAQMEGMSAMEKRLFLLRMRMNKGRKENRSAVDEEYKKMTDPNYEKKQRAKEWTEKRKHAATADEKDSFLNETAAAAAAKMEKNAEKQKNANTFGWQAFTQEADYKAYKKRLGALPTGSQAEAAGKFDPMQYGKVATDVSSDGKRRVVADIEDREKKREKYSRRRNNFDSSSGGINDKNEVFNKKIKRSFDKYTVEIRQNLERGTAL